MPLAVEIGSDIGEDLRLAMIECIINNSPRASVGGLSPFQLAYPHMKGVINDVEDDNSNTVIDKLVDQDGQMEVLLQQYTQQYSTMLVQILKG